ncbi:DUF6153 family protein [Micromonospora viridifaciens]|uniref:DUF6153 family protein n=1 Tax=Micromonospora viridifaciens TaxID=1881 RepID=UPI001E4351D5|nr:DUF6153 family protein [Micromonospora viridifaciens]
MNEPGLRRQMLLRLMLLVVLTFGVFGMHTFGHPPDLGRSAAGHMTAAAHEIDPVPVPEQGHDGSHGQGDSLDAFSVCLAVLGTALVLISLAMLRQRRWDLPMPASAQPWAAGQHRAPPRRPIGLRLTAVSVLRT